MGLDLVVGGVGTSVIERLLDPGSKPCIVFRVECDVLLKRRDQHGNRGEFAFNDHLSTGTDMGQQGGKVADGFRFRDVDDSQGKNNTSSGGRPEAVGTVAPQRQVA